MQQDIIEKWIYNAAAKEKRIQALALWVNDSLCILRVKVEADFDKNECTNTNITEKVDEAYIQYLDNNTNSDVGNPEKFS